MVFSSFIKKLMFTRQFDIQKGKVSLLRHREMIVSPDFVLSIQEECPHLVYSTAKDNFRNKVNYLRSEKGITGNKLLNFSLDLFEAYGLGAPSLLEKGEKIIVDVESSPFPQKIQQKGETACSYSAGALAGIFSAIENEDLDGKEVKCVGKGDRVCKFKIE